MPLLRQSIYRRLAGYEDVNDAERLSVDPAMRPVVGGRAALTDKQAASTSEVGRFETEILSIGSNLKKLRISVSKRPTSLVEAACLSVSAALPPTT